MAGLLTASVLTQPALAVPPPELTVEDPGDLTPWHVRPPKKPWDHMFDDLELSGNWAQDVITVAETQLGYEESKSDWIIFDGEHKGYTIYGDWWGVPYGDWCAMFLSFCLHFAQVPTEAMPEYSYCQWWVEDLEEKDQIGYPGEYVPKVGDLVFFAWTKKGFSTHVGLITSVTKDSRGFTIETIEGNTSNCVHRRSYRSDSKGIMCYGILPDYRTWGQPEHTLLREFPY